MRSIYLKTRQIIIQNDSVLNEFAPASRLQKWTLAAGAGSSRAAGKRVVSAVMLLTKSRNYDMKITVYGITSMRCRKWMS
jgi:hypothetical protein